MQHAAVGLAVFVCFGCSGEPTGPAPEVTEHKGVLTASVPSEPRWNDIVGGEERVLSADGKVLASRKFDASAAELLAAQVELDAPTKSSTARLIPVTGLGYQDGALHAYTYLVRASVQEGVGYAEKEAGDPVAPEELAAVFDTALQQKVAKATQSERIPVLVTLHQSPTTSLAQRPLAKDLVSFGEPSIVDRQSAITARVTEVEALHAPLRQRLSDAGVAVTSLRSFWLTGGLAGSLTSGELSALAADPAVRAITLDQPTPGAVANTWDGTNVWTGGTDGLNASHYWAGGYFGEGYNPGEGRSLRLGLVGDGFHFNHAVFNTSGTGSSRFVMNWDCRTGACTQIFTPLGTGTHETEVSTAAGGSALENQIPGVTNVWDQLDRTGVARRARMYSAEGTDHSQMIAALQRMIQEGVDVVNFSRGDYDDTPTTCDYDAIVDQWSLAIKQAHDVGVLVINSGGNAANAQGTCSITRWAQATSGFTVGGTVNPPDNGYATANRDTNYSVGGMNARVYQSSSGTYTTHNAVLSAIDALAPGSWRFGATTPNNFAQTGGTSLAAPQLAGAAMLVKHAYLAAGVNYINSPGVLFTTLLSMTDRASLSGLGHSAVGFNPHFGGGRFQLRYFAGGSDHPAGGAWGFDLWETMIYNGNQIDFPIRGTGPEPASILQFKVYAMVFEESWKTVADVDLSVRDKNCGSGSTQLGADTSRDVKSRVRIGGIAAGKELCVRLYGYSVPAGGRRVVLASYFSVDTQMR